MYIYGRVLVIHSQNSLELEHFCEFQRQQEQHPVTEIRTSLMAHCSKETASSITLTTATPNGLVMLIFKDAQDITSKIPKESVMNHCRQSSHRLSIVNAVTNA